MKGRRSKCERDGHAWAPESEVAYQVTDICVRGRCQAKVTRDMTDSERDDFDIARELEEAWDD